jgi:tocopherol O-methyltransferase
MDPERAGDGAMRRPPPSSEGLDPLIRSRSPIVREQIAKHYDSLDPFYRKLWGEHLHHGLWESGRETPAEAVLALVDRVAQRAGLRTGDIVCDVGCGYGATARMLAADYDVHVTGLTLSPVQHAHARDRAAGDPRVSFRLRDWLDNDFDDSAFDVIVAIESTEHMDDKPRAFAEFARTLRPGGRLVVCAWIAADAPGPWQRRFLLEPICDEGRLPSLGTEAQYMNWIRAAGLAPLDVSDLSRRVRRTWSICMRRVATRLLTPTAWRFLLDARHPDRAFALTLPRILLAYHSNAMRYLMLYAVRPSGPLEGKPDFASRDLLAGEAE